MRNLSVRTKTQEYRLRESGVEFGMNDHVQTNNRHAVSGKGTDVTHSHDAGIARTRRVRPAHCGARVRELQESFRQIAKQVKPAVVNISTAKNLAARNSPELEPFIENFRQFFR